MRFTRRDAGVIWQAGLNVLLFGGIPAIAIGLVTGAGQIVGWPIAASALLMLTAWLLERGSLRPDPMALILVVLVVVGVGTGLQFH